MIATTIASCTSRSGSGPSSPADSTTTTADPALAADLRAAQRAQLDVDDLDDSYEAQPNDNRDTGDLADRTERCIAAVAPGVRAQTGLDGFESPSAGTAGSKVMLFTDAAAAVALFVAARGDGFRSCFRDAVREGIQQSATAAGSNAVVTNVAVADATLDRPDPGIDLPQGWQAVATIKAGSIDVTASVDVFFVAKGRAVAMLLWSRAPGTLDRAAEQRAARSVALRLPE